MNSITLRPYQESAVKNAVEMLQERGNSLIVAGTGAGKTIMMAAAIGRFSNGFYAEKKRRPHTLVLVHRTEIHDQNRTKFENVCPFLATSEIAACKKSLHGYVHFGMVQTVFNLLNEFEKSHSFFDLIVIDEAHHARASTYEAIIEWNKRGNPSASLLGVTATPNRGDGLPLIELFDNFNQITSKFLIDSHFLVRPRFIDRSPVFKTRDGEEKGCLNKNCNIKDMIGNQLIRRLCEDYLELKEKGKTVIFAPTHEFCRLIYEILKDLGRKPAYLAFNLDEVGRKTELKKFETGECDDLINVDICTEGYDFPELRNIVDFDTNGTEGQWIQKVGRVLRTAPGKISCTVIDFGGNIERYPNGVETSVNLNGVYRKPKGEYLSVEELFEKPYRNEGKKETRLYTVDEERICSPYNPPYEFETVLDKDYGIVFVACTEQKDFIILKNNEEYEGYVSDKHAIKKIKTGSFKEAVQEGVKTVGNVIKPNIPIGKVQVSLLAPEYATTALDWYGANCCICWKTWKGEIKRCMKKSAELKM